MRKTLNLTIALFALGLGAAATTITGDISDYSAVVRYDLTIKNAPPLPNPILIGGAYSGPGSPAGSTGQGIQNWSQITDLSLYLASLAPTGTAYSQWGGVHFLVDNPDDKRELEVFTMDASLLSGATWYEFLKTNKTASVVVNIRGDKASMPSGGWNYGNLDPAKVLINFVDAKSVNISSMAIGAILAPSAALTIKNGTIGGSLISDSLYLESVGTGGKSFTGKIPGWAISAAAPPPPPESLDGQVPEPSTWVMMSAGPLLLVIGKLRKKVSA